MGTPTARRLSDEQLRTAQLVVDNPLEFEGVTIEPPDKSLSGAVIAEYHLKADQPPVRCSYCDQRQRHQHGFIVEFLPPARHLVGSDCGQAKLDLQFSAARKRHSELLSRQRLLHRMDAILAQRESLSSSCHDVLFGDPLKALEAKAAELSRHAGDAVIRLQALARSGGQLTESVAVRDWDAERRRDEHREEGKEGGPIYRFDIVPIGHLRGTAVLLAGSLRVRIHSLKQELTSLSAIARDGTEQLSNSRLSRALSAIDQHYEDARAAIASLNDASAFFELSHVRLLARWARDGANGALWARSDQLYAGDTAIQPIPVWAVPQLPILPR